MVNTLDVGSSPTINYFGRGPVPAELNLLLNAVDYDCCAVLSCIGDSTSYLTDKWFYRLVNEVLPLRLPNTCIRYCVWDDTSQAYLGWTTLQNGAAGPRYASFPGNALQGRITLNGDLVAAASSDFEVEVKFSSSAWPVAAQTRLIGQLGGAGQQSWYMTLETGGTIAFRGSFDGTNLSSLINSSVQSFTASQIVTIKATHQANNGSGGYTTTLYKSTDDGATWTQIGQTVNTVAGASPLHSTTADCNLGIVSGTGPLTGNVYHAVVRDGIGGPARTPYAIDAWGVANTTNSPFNDLGGSPTLYVFNGSRSGAGLDYFTDTTRLPKMNMFSPVQLTFLNTGHNDQGYRGLSRWNTIWTSFISSLRSRLPTSAFIGFNQNPRDPGVTTGKQWIDEVRQMQCALPFLLQRFGIPVIDIRHSYKGATLANVINQSDGVHPVTAGSNLQIVTLGKVSQASPI